MIKQKGLFQANCEALINARYLKFKLFLDISYDNHRDCDVFKLSSHLKSKYISGWKDSISPTCNYQNYIVTKSVHNSIFEKVSIM